MAASIVCILCFLHRSCFSFTCHMSSSFLPRSTVPIVQRVPNAHLKASVWLRRGPRCASGTTGVAASLDGGSAGVYLWNLWPDDHVKIAESNSNQWQTMKLRTYTKIPPSNSIYIYKLSIHCIHQVPNHHHLVPNRTFPESPSPKRMGFTATKKKLRASNRWCHQIGFSATPTTDPWLGAPIGCSSWNGIYSPCWMIKCEDITSRNVTLKTNWFWFGRRLWDDKPMPSLVRRVDDLFTTKHVEFMIDAQLICDHMVYLPYN